MKSPTEVNKTMVSSESYRAFLATLLSPEATGVPRGRLSEVARRAGLSRSFLSEVLSGKKSLTPSSFLKLQSALRLPSGLKKFFALLVAQEHEALLPLLSLKSSADAQVQLQDLRERLGRKVRTTQSQRPDPKKRVFSLDLFCIYAALGSLSDGASLMEIRQRTGFSDAQMLRSLECLTTLGWVRAKDDRYFATERAFDFEALGPDMSFIRTFAAACAQLSRNASALMQNRNNLLFFSAFSLPADRVHEFREEARELLLELLDKYQDDRGTKVKRVTLGIY